MLLPLAAALVALACVLASARRLWFAAYATVLDPGDVLRALDGGASLARLRETVAGVPDAEWERELFAALETPQPEARAALVNEQLTELDFRLQRWSRVPRVCASVATSVAILLGTMVLRRGVVEAPDLTEDFGQAFLWSLLGDAITVVAFGLVGTAFCIGAHAYARRTTRARLEAADRMVERLEGMAALSTRESTRESARPT